MPKYFLVLLFIINVFTSTAQKKAGQSAIDIEQYSLELDVSDFTKNITGTAHIDFIVKIPVSELSFDLVAPNTERTGMTVTNIRMGEEITWSHLDETIVIKKQDDFERGRKYRISIDYNGLPSDGLIISKNKHNDYTVFGDNWPNRAHFWFPCIDHPSDKALVEFKITYPKKYKVVANGKMLLDSSISRHNNFIHWQSTTLLPTKVMVFGMAEFEVSEPCMVDEVPVTSWIFKKQAEDGFADYAIACEVLAWFEDKIADYPYSKLANVQSKTRYGGMENASCIFYYEESVNGQKQVEDLIAHEIAHQWFGNSATELDWEHLWLSEGFATYLTDMYLLEKYGKEAFQERLKGERDKAINFYKIYQAPVVDTLATNINALLNPNSYQKGAWTLHMLRHEVGDSMFWEIVKIYYGFYQLSNASTDNFIDVVNRITNADYNWFFNQWLKTEGHPNLEINWKRLKNNVIDVDVVQTQKELFEFNLPLFFTNGKFGDLHTEAITKRKTSFKVELKESCDGLIIDPQTKLFFEAVVTEKK